MKSTRLCAVAVLLAVSKRLLGDAGKAGKLLTTMKASASLALLMTFIVFSGCSMLMPQARASSGIIYSDAEDGHVANFGAVSSVASNFFVGDLSGSSNNYYRGFVKFSLSGISGTLASATLNLYVESSRTNDTYDGSSPLTNPGLGDCLVRHIGDYGTLDAGDFSTSSIGNDPSAIIGGGATPNSGYVSTDITAAMQDDLNNGRAYTSFMIKLALDTDNDGREDDWSFSTMEYPGTEQDPYIEFPEPHVADLAGFTASPTDDVLMAIGDLKNNPHGSKPSGVNYQIGRDMTPLGYVRGMLDNSQPDMFDTNAAMNSTTGRPIGDWPLIFSIGGPGINSVSHYYETTTNASDRAPVTFSMNSTHYIWTNRTDDEVLAVLRSSCNVPPGTNDVFVIQVSRDADGRLVVIMYGTHYTGTWAAAEYFKFTVYPTISSWTDSYYIVQWTDATSGTSANFMPDSGDTFTILAQGIS